jgi:hypothetical protein
MLIFSHVNHKKEGREWKENEKEGTEKDRKIEQLIAWSGVLGKMMVSQMTKKFSALNTINWKEKGDKRKEKEMEKMIVKARLLLFYIAVSVADVNEMIMGTDM